MEARISPWLWPVTLLQQRTIQPAHFVFEVVVACQVGRRCCCGKFYVLVRVCGGPIKGVAQASISYYSPAKNTGIEEIPKKPAPTSNSFKRTLLLVFLVLRPPSPHRLPCHGRGFCDRVYYSQLKITAGAWDWVTRGKAIINHQQPQAHVGNIIIITDIELSSRGGYKDQNFSDSLPLIILRTLGSCVGIMEFIIQSPPATARPSVRVWPMAVVAAILSCPLLILMKGWNSASQPGKYVG